MAFVRAASVSEITPGKGKEVQVAGKTLAVFHTNGSFYAIDNTCPHKGAPLAEGEVIGTEVVCPWHAAAFDLTTGANLCPPAMKGVRAYPVQIIGDEVHVDVE